MPKYDIKAYPILLGKMTDALKEATDKAALSAGARMVAYLQTTVIPATRPQPVDRGKYRAGWTFKKVKNGVYVYNRVLHASFVEYGTRKVVPGKKVIEAIAAWVRRKGIGSVVVTNKKGQSKIRKPNKQKALEIAWSIVMGAKKKGGFFDHGRGLKVFKRAIPQLAKMFRQEVNSEIKKSLGK